MFCLAKDKLLPGNVTGDGRVGSTKLFVTICLVLAGLLLGSCEEDDMNMD